MTPAPADISPERIATMASQFINDSTQGMDPQDVADVLLELRQQLTASEKRVRELEAQLHEVAQQEPPHFRCEHCDNGRWEAECCNGSSGCSCGGEPVDMGPCRVCNGTGWRTDDADRTANLRSIQGLCYLGSGPR